MFWKKSNFYLSLSLILLSFFTFIQSRNFCQTSAKFPRLLSIFLFSLSIMLLFSSLLKNKEKAATKEFNAAPVIMLVMGLIVYIIFLKWIGYLFSSIILIFYTVLTLGYKNKRKAILFSIISAIVIYILFRALETPLPMGILSSFL